MLIFCAMYLFSQLFGWPCNVSAISLLPDSRWYPAVFAVVGHSIRDFSVEGMVVPAGQKVMGCLWGTLHDPQVFSDPER